MKYRIEYEDQRTRAARELLQARTHELTRLYAQIDYMPIIDRIPVMRQIAALTRELEYLNEEYRLARAAAPLLFRDERTLPQSGSGKQGALLPSRETRRDPTQYKRCPCCEKVKPLTEWRAYRPRCVACDVERFRQKQEQREKKKRKKT